jgi:hypothetical protein
MHAIRRAAAVLLPFALAACPGDPMEPHAQVLTPIGEVSAATRFDPAVIEGARVEGDRLHLEVAHGGGCAEHDFGLHFEPVFLESEPVQSVLRLSHDAHGDPCRAWIGRALVFDLTPLKEAYRRAYGTRSGTIDLRLHEPGVATPRPGLVRYTFGGS